MTFRQGAGPRLRAAANALGTMVEHSAASCTNGLVTGYFKLLCVTGYVCSGSPLITDYRCPLAVGLSGKTLTMANTAALPLSPPLSPPMTFRNKKRRLQWDMGEYQDSMASESCVPLLSAADSQGMMISCGNPAFPGFLGFEGALLNGELQLQNVCMQH